jgi:hypothetical protein
MNFIESIKTCVFKKYTKNEKTFRNLGSGPAIEQ